VPFSFQLHDAAFNHKPPRPMILPIIFIATVILVIAGIFFTDSEVDFSDIPQRPSRRK
jgi:hypothetical protein